jgi:hypothetical protein
VRTRLCGTKVGNGVLTHAFSAAFPLIFPISLETRNLILKQNCHLDRSAA